ncbi:MAG: tetratricopeptide repeat protein [Chthonomonadales bacterium]
MHRLLAFSFLVAIFFLPTSPVLAMWDTPEEQLAAASALYDAHKWAQAAVKLETFLKDNPKHMRVGAAAYVLGKCRTEQQQYPQAIAAFEKSLATKDPDVTLMSEMGLAEAAMNSKQYEKALAALEIAVKGGLKSDQAALAWFWLGQANFQLDRFARSEEAYDRVLKSYAKSEFAEGAAYGSALATLRQYRNDSARLQFRNFLQKYPNSPDRSPARLFLGQIDMEAKRYSEARTNFEAALETRNGKGPDAEIRAAAEDGLIEALLQMQDYRAATTRLESALVRLPATDPQRFHAQLSLGHCYYRQKQYNPALAAYAEAAKSPEVAVRSEGFYWGANSAIALNHPADAGLLFTKAAAADPNSPNAAKSQMKAGDAYLSAKQSDSASSAYRAVVDHYPNSPEAPEARKALSQLTDSVTDPAQLLALSKSAPKVESSRATLRAVRLFMEQKRYPEAKATLTDFLKPIPGKTAVAMDSSTAEAHYLMGLVYDHDRQPAQAVKALADATGAQPNALWAPDALGRLAWLYLELKRAPDAERVAAAALTTKLPPKAEEQARLAQVQAQLDQSKWSVALEGCQRLLANQPQPDTIATVLYTQAWIFGKQNKPDDALPLWEKLLSDYPKSSFVPEALLHVGDSRLKAEKYADAEGFYSRLLSGFPASPLALEAHFKRGSSLYNDAKPAEAATEFDLVADAKDAGEYVPEALYWAGVALEKASKKELAIQRLSKLIATYPKHARIANAKIRLAGLRAVKE